MIKVNKASCIPACNCWIELRNETATALSVYKNAKNPFLWISCLGGLPSQTACTPALIDL
jgi:hypothetical protein